MLIYTHIDKSTVHALSAQRHKYVMICNPVALSVYFVGLSQVKASSQNDLSNFPAWMFFLGLLCSIIMFLLETKLVGDLVVGSSSEEDTINTKAGMVIFTWLTILLFIVGTGAAILLF